jgi:hypothetical protein
MASADIGDGALVPRIAGKGVVRLQLELLESLLDGGGGPALAFVHAAIAVTATSAAIKQARGRCIGQQLLDPRNSLLLHCFQELEQVGHLIDGDLSVEIRGHRG